MAQFTVLLTKEKSGEKDGKKYSYQQLLIADENSNHCDFNYFGNHKFKPGDVPNFEVCIRWDSTRKQSVISTAIVMPEDREK